MTVLLDSIIKSNLSRIPPPANYTGSYTTVSKEIANTEIAMSQSADRVTIDNINIVSETTITIEMQMLWLTDKQRHVIVLQGQDV